MKLTDQEYSFLVWNLKSLGFKNYNEYLLSNWWLNKFEVVFKFHERKCQICGSKNRIVIHHKTYEHLGNEPMKDLMILCQTCHIKEHKKEV